MKYPFLKEEIFGLRTQVSFVGNKCEIYLPASFFNSNPSLGQARELGDRIETIGLFWFKADGKWYECSLPLSFQFEFSDVRREKLSLKAGIPVDDYIVYTLKNGDAFVYDILHKKDLDDLKSAFLSKIIEGGKMPKTISYDQSLNIFLKAMEATEFYSLGVSSVSLEFMLAELYRNKKNLREPFRMVYNGKNKYDFRMVRITKVPELNSTFTSLIGEDSNNQLVSSILRKREGAEEKESPIEKILKY